MAMSDTRIQSPGSARPYARDMRVALVLLGLGILGCGGEPSRASPPPTPTPASTPPASLTPPIVTTPPAPTPPVTAPPPTTPSPPVTTPGPCGVHETAFRAALASASGACASDSDCACYSPVVEEAGCGGVTDAATARALSRIQEAWHADGCRWPRQCGPSRCDPICRDGHCARRSLVDPASL